MTTVTIETHLPILAATTTDQDRAIGALVTAFSADPACRWAWPEPRQYLESFPGFARAFGGKAFEAGAAYCTPDFTGAALWLPPGVHSDEEALGELLERTVSAEILGELVAVFEQMASYHPDEPHWYLPLIGVDPNVQGRGYGSALLRPALEACDHDGIPAYLESSNPRNISLYQRHGFELLATIQVGDSPPISPMLRKPR